MNTQSDKLKKQLLGRGGILFAVVVGLALSFSMPAHSKKGDKHRSHDMKLVGTNDLQARSAYQPIVHEHPDGRFIAYIGHHSGEAPNPLNGGAVEPNGVSIIDVTDPKHPVYLHHLPGNRGAQMVRACNGDDLSGPNTDGKVYLLRATREEHQIYDVTDPSDPQLVSEPVINAGNTHKNYWECSTGIAYLVTDLRPEGWAVSRVGQIFDLSDPANPVFIRNFGLPGQQPGTSLDSSADPQGMHGCISVIEKNRVYCGHGTRSDGRLVIWNREDLLTPAPAWIDPERPTDAELQAPLITKFNTPSYMGAHSAIPLLGYNLGEFANDFGGAYADRDFVAIVNEAIRNECGDDFRQLVYLVDITEEENPMPLSNFNVPEAEGDYCSKGGRFGAHAGHENPTSIFHNKLLIVSWFNAGVRAIDIRDPFNPRQAAFYIPKITDNTDVRDGKFAIQTNNVEVDDRGFIYITDRANTGLHILELKGKARKIADLP
jgi:hypothetical protein